MYLRILSALLSILLLGAAPARAQDPAAGSFSQLAGAAGCTLQIPTIEEVEDPEFPNPLRDCARGNGLLSARAVAVSPDGLHVYVAASGTRQFGSNAVSAYTRAPDTGALTQIGCISDDGGDGRVGSDGLCENGHALLGANDVKLSPDGRYVYVASAWANGLSWFERDPATGRLTQKGCFKEVVRDGACRQGRALLGANGVAVSPDGRHVYVLSNGSDAIAIFEHERSATDPETGETAPESFEQVGCVSHNGSDGACIDGTALTGASSASVTPDGRFVYVTAAEVGSVTWHARDPETGLLTPRGCLIDEAPRGGSCSKSKPLAGAGSSAVTPDGKQVLVAGSTNGTLVVYSRAEDTGALERTACFQHVYPRGDDVFQEEDEFEEELDEEEEEFAEEDEFEEDFEEEEEPADPLIEGCEAGKALGAAREVTISGDGRVIFVTGGDYLAAFTRNPDTGTVRQFACAEQFRSYKSCTDGRGLSGASGLAATQDGRNLYVTSSSQAVVSVFAATAAVASRHARLARRGRIMVRVACPRARLRSCAGRAWIARKRARPSALQGRFRLAPGTSRMVRMRVPADIRRKVRRRSRARATVVLRDARRVTRLTGRRIAISRRR